MLADVQKRIEDASINPRDIKMELAREIVSIFHDADAAVRAEQDFVSRFRDKDVPDDIPVFAVTGSANIVDVIAEAKLAKSKGEARRLIEGGGVTVDGRKAVDWKETLDLKAPVVLKVGKRHYARVIQG